MRVIVILISMLMLVGGSAVRAEPIRLESAEATFQNPLTGNLSKVIDGVEIGPEGWSVAPQIDRPQAIIFRCAKPLEAAELDILLFFLAGRPRSSFAEFSLSYTTDAKPEMHGDWQPLAIRRFSASLAKLQRMDNGHLRMEPMQWAMSGTIPDDTYRIAVYLPGGRATGFRLDAYPVANVFHADSPDRPPIVMSWANTSDFVLTEFRVEDPQRHSTNIAFHRPVKASHPLEGKMSPDALTDGLPATIAHPRDPAIGPQFYYDIDLGRSAAIDHISLRTRGDGFLDRFTRMRVRLYDTAPVTGAPVLWDGMARADGSYPGLCIAEILRAADGQGNFRGRYLRISSDNKAIHSPQLAEVEVYETRTPVVDSVFADGQELEWKSVLDIPPGVRRLSVQVRIPQIGMPKGNIFRWRLPGSVEQWQMSRQTTIDMACPAAGESALELQALHSDGQWDGSLYRLPVLTRQFFWETTVFRWLAACAIILATVGLTLLWARWRAALKLERARAASALADERARISCDIHDELGSSLTQIALLSELVQAEASATDGARTHADEIFTTARSLARSVDDIVWAVNPANDDLEHFAQFASLSVQRFLRAAGLACTLDIPEHLPDIPMSAAVRHNLLLALRQAVQNAITHAKASRVGFALSHDGKRLRMVVSDNGRGFDPQNPAASRPGGGQGLKGMRDRMTALGGTFTVDSRPDSGTTLTFELDLNRATHPSA